MPWKKYLIIAAVVLISLCIFGLVFVYWGNQKTQPKYTRVVKAKNPPKDIREQQIKEQMRKIFVRDIDVAGQVVDENGTPLQNVNLLSAVHMAGVGTKQYQKVLKDGQFSFKLSNCMALDLYFSKTGHFKKKMVFSPHSPNDPNPPKWNEVVDGNRLVIREEDLKVELESLGGGWNVMDEYPVVCKFSTSGKWKGTVFEPNPEYSAVTRKTRAMKPFITKVVEFSPDNIPENCIYIIAPLTAENRIRRMSRTFRLINMTSSYTKEGSPEKSFLCFSGDENGFSLADLKLIELQRFSGQWASLMNRQLKEAPLDGYSTKAEIIPAPEIAKRFFFVRIMGYFGRLSVKPPNNIRRDESIDCRFDVYLQPNGSRDVRSMEGADYDHSAAKVGSRDKESQAVIPNGHYSYHLAGQVIDQDGKQVKDYQVKSYPGFSSTKAVSRTFENEFKLNATGSVFNVIVIKDGYYSERLFLDGYDNELLKKVGATKSGKAVTASNIIIKLQETGPITRLSTVDLFPGDVDYKVGMDPSGLFLKEQGETLRALPAGFKLPANAPPKISVMYLRAAEANGSLKNPLEVKLGVGGTGNGLVIFKPSGKDSNPKILLRELKEAPKVEYSSEVTVDSTQKHQFFFFKFDDFFGKGYLTSTPKASPDGKRLLVGMILYFQPNKSRNVRTK